MEKAFYVIVAITLLVVVAYSTDFFFRAEATEGYVQEKIMQANYCNAHEDCINIDVPCAFGCFVLINRAEEESIKKWINEYYAREGAVCTPKCAELGLVRCKNGKCGNYYPQSIGDECKNDYQCRRLNCDYKKAFCKANKCACPKEPLFVTEISIKETGESIAGLLYEKQLNVRGDLAGHLLEYYCNTFAGSVDYCACKDLEITETPEGFKTELLLSRESAMKLARQIENLEDEGQSASCCDHPFQEIRVVYSNGKTVEKTLFQNMIDLQEVGCAECGSDSDCVITGCVRQICAIGESYTGCDFKPEYDCYRQGITDCVCQNWRCGWLETPELNQCLDER